MNTKKITQQILKKYNIKANKKYGQNFLLDDDILNGIVEVSNVNKNDLVIEIGPGLGNLTTYFIDSCKYALLIELDTNLLNILKDRFSEKNNYEIINEDILNLNLDLIIKELELKLDFKFDNIKVIANLPYYITSPIIFKLLQESNLISDITIMIQKEVAQRLVASPKSKSYGILTIMTKYYANVTYEIDVNKTAFEPVPNVDSAVVNLKKYDKYFVKDEKLFFELIHKAFNQRRKKLINSLVSNKFNNMDKPQIEELLLKSSVSINSRAEELDITDYINLTENL